jgi:cell division protein FtsQ
MRRFWRRRPEPVVDEEVPEEPAEAEAEAERIDIGLLLEAPKLSQVDEPDREPAEDPEVVVLHDKMRRRRILVRREEGRRRLKRVAWGLAGVTLLVDGAALAHTTFLDVDRVEVEGAVHVSSSTVRWASGIAAGDALLTLDKRGVARRIRELSWVDDVAVEKRWPSTVRLVVRERVPVALVRTTAPSGPLAIVDASGRVLQIGGEIPPGLMTVTDVPPPLREGGELPVNARRALRVAVAANKRAPGALSAVSTRLEGTLTRGGVVRFGSVDRLEEKLLAVSTVLARVDVACLDVLDVKVPGSPTVSRGRC